MRRHAASPWVALGAPILVLLGSIVSAEPAVTSDAGLCSKYGPRFECGDNIKDSRVCEARGCCWAPAYPVSRTRRVKLPPCFTTNGNKSTYKLVGNTTSGGSLSGVLRQTASTQPELGPDIAQLAASLHLYAPDIVQVKIIDPASSRWEVPASLFGKLPDPARTASKNGNLTFDVESDPFVLSVSRGNTELLHTDAHRFVYKDQYIELTTMVPMEASLYGLAEHTPSRGLRLRRDGLPITLWNRDIGASNADTNLYGSHPFVMVVLPDGTAHGLVLLNSNGMEVSLTVEGITWRAIGGVVDLRVLGGPTPAAVLEQLTRLVGRPHMPPYWSLGFHQCKWGYETIDEVEQVVANYTAAAIPLETMWTDIDYMDGWKDFTVDPVKFPLNRFQAWVEKLHGRGQRWVPIVDPGIKVEPGEAAYDDGIAKDVFLKDVTGQPYIGQVWPGATHYPDFTHPAAQQWWQHHLKEWHDQLPFDGLWIDMNEVANFCTGDVCKVPAEGMKEDSLGANADAFQDNPTICFLECQTAAEALAGKAPNNPRQLKVDDVPYPISNGNNRLALGQNTAAMSASHHDGALQYDTHNLYGVHESLVSYPAMAAITGARPFVLSRSTFLGSGQYAAHWTGDNAATWEDLRWSISAVLNSGLFGVPFAGADICGFMYNTTEELCNRWISAGAFYPFSRDHSGANTESQELYRWPSLAEAGRRALTMRYQLLPYIYSAFHEAHETGAPVARPVFWADARDSTARDADGQFLLGDSVLVSPVLTQGANSVRAYFPRGIWYSMWDPSHVDALAHGVHETLPAPLGHVPLHVHGGTVVAMQQAALTTTEVRNSPLTLVVALAPEEQDLSEGEAWRASARQNLRRFLRRILALAIPHSAPLGLTYRLSWLHEAVQRRVRPAGRSSASGWMFRDDADPLQVPNNRDNFLSFSAVLEPLPRGDSGGGDVAAAGAVTVHFGRGDRTVGNCGGMSWPLLDGLRVLGVHHKVDPASVAVDVGPASQLAPAALKVGISSSFPSSKGNTRSVPASQMEHSAETGVLVVRGLQAPLRCPHALRVSWASSAQSAAS